MGDRTSYTPGTFSWAELPTSDPDDAKRFYGELFGWDFEDLPMPGDAGAYTMARLDGKDVAALFQAREGMPTFWGSYVTVESADSTAARAADLGGTLMTEPFDVMESGRMAIVQDPTGAVFSIWQPRGSIGATWVNGPGAISLNQLNTTDPEAAQRFYSELFGWRIEDVSSEETRYWGIYNADSLNGGMMAIPPEGGGMPSHWLIYFGSEDVDADAERLGGLGAQVMVPPTDAPGGRFLVAQDPQGAVFGLFAGRFDD
jgi:predicted enzyme related to lactoylglutathione lyase